MQPEKKKKYQKPKIIHRQNIEVLATACDSQWMPQRVCMLQGQSSCTKTRF